MYAPVHRLSVLQAALAPRTPEDKLIPLRSSDVVDMPILLTTLLMLIWRDMAPAYCKLHTDARYITLTVSSLSLLSS